MQTIHKKLVLAMVIGLLAEGTRTKTIIKRSTVFKDANIGASDVEAAINYGLKKNVLKSLSNGYVEALEDEYCISESDYYDCIGQMLEGHYRDRLTPDGRFLVSKTARKGTKVAGRWTRPDFTVVANRRFPYIREVEFDIITFEVKRPADCEALAVFEALAHNSAATRSYVFFPVTDADLAQNAQGERIREECVRHGIGLFLVEESYRLEKAYLAIESQRRALNPEKCSQFLESVLTPEELGKLTTWA